MYLISLLIRVSISIGNPPREKPNQREMLQYCVIHYLFVSECTTLTICLKKCRFPVRIEHRTYQHLKVHFFLFCFYREDIYP